MKYPFHFFILLALATPLLLTSCQQTAASSPASSPASSLSATSSSAGGSSSNKTVSSSAKKSFALTYVYDASRVLLLDKSSGQTPASSAEEGTSVSFSLAFQESATQKRNLAVKLGTTDLTAATDGSYSFTVSAAATITVSVDLNHYSVVLPTSDNVSFTAVAGYASPLEYGSDFKFTAAALKSEYSQLQGLTLKAGETSLSKDANGVYTISAIKADTTVTMSGLSVNQLTVSADAGDWGYFVFYDNDTLAELASAPTGVAAGGSLTFKVGSNEPEYSQLRNLAVKNGSTLLTPNSAGYYILTSLDADVVLTASLDKNSYAITLPQDEKFSLVASDGSALPSTIEHGASLSFKFTYTDPSYANWNYEVKAGADTLSADANGLYTITSVTADLTITVSATSIQDKINSGFSGLWNYVHSGSEATLANGTYTYATGQSLTTTTALVKDALDQGYTHMKFAMSCSGADHFLLTSGGTGFDWNTYWKQTSGDSVEFYVDLNTLHSGDNYGTLTILPRNSSAAAYTASPMTLGGITFYKSATSSWTKSGTCGYACLEDAKTLIVDTQGVGNDARVYADYSWLSQFATSGLSLKFKFLLKGSNTRGPILGKRTGTSNTDYTAGDMTTADSDGYYAMSLNAATMAAFTSSDSLEIGLDHEGVVQIIIQ